MNEQPRISLVEKTASGSYSFVLRVGAHELHLSNTDASQIYQLLDQFYKPHNVVGFFAPARLGDQS